jgi:peroxiredoxin
MTSAIASDQASSIPVVGDLAPDITIQGFDGRSVALSSLWSGAERGLALVFLRHFGCPFCKEHARAIEAGKTDFAQAGISVAYIGCGTAEEAQAFQDDLNLTSPVYYDPERLSYHAYAIGDATAGSMFNPRVLVGGIRAAGRGYLPKRSSGNPLQLQSQFLIDRDGIIRSVTRPELMSDIPSADDLLEAARLLPGSQRSTP